MISALAFAFVISAQLFFAEYRTEVKVVVDQPGRGVKEIENFEEGLARELEKGFLEKGMKIEMKMGKAR